MKDEQVKMYRYFLKDNIRKKIAFKHTDQNQDVPAPPITKPYPDGSVLIDLPGPDEWKHIFQTDITHTIGNRKSHRVYLNQSFSLEELDALLGLDGEEKFAVYLAPVGKVKKTGLLKHETTGC